MTFSYLQIFLTVSLPIMGLAYALLGCIKLSLVERLQIDEGKVGKMVGAFGTMFGPTIVLCGFLTDHLGPKEVWVVGSAVLALAIFILATTRSYAGAVVAVLLLGVGWAAQVNVGNVLMRIATPKDRPPAELIWVTNFYDFVFGFGAFVTPMLLGFLLRKMAYTKAVILIAAVAVLPVVLGIPANMTEAPEPPKSEAPAKAEAAPAEKPVEKPAEKPAEPPKETGIGGLLKSPLFWVIGFAFLFFVPLETSVGGWATTLVTRNTPQEVAPESAKKAADLALTGYWMGFTGSRLLVSLFGSFGIMARILGPNEATHPQKLLLVMASISVAVMVYTVFLRGRGQAIGAVLLAGLAFGPVFPTMMGIVLLSVPPEAMGRAVGFFFFFASVGWTVIPALIGTVAKRTDNIQKGFAVAAASGAVFLAFVIARGLMV